MPTTRERPNLFYRLIFSLFDKALMYSWMRRRPLDVERMAYVLATVDSAEFFQQSMPDAPNLRSKWPLLDYAIELVEIDGLWLEFGVFRAASTRRIAGHTKGPVYGFDSFEGLPEDWTHFQKKGRFSLGGDLPQVPDNVELIKGWFDETLPPFLAAHPDPVAFLHVDSDLYSSARTVLTELTERIVPGTVILFDEYFNYPGWRDHEHKAFMEFIAKTGFGFEYVGFASSYMSVAVRITTSS